MPVLIVRVKLSPFTKTPDSSLFSTQSGCYEDFSGVSMTVLRDVKVPTNSPDLPGFGTNQNIFRTDEDMKLHVTKTGLLYRTKNTVN